MRRRLKGAPGLRCSPRRPPPPCSPRSWCSSRGPANAAVTGLVQGSRDGTVHLSLLPLAGAVPLTAAAVAVACALSSRRT
ncbi:hypothetical protein ACWCZ5_27190 [Streptomyces sp. NPDC001667]